MKSINLTTVLLIGIAVLLTLQLNSCFGKTQKTEAMIRNEMKLEMLEKALPGFIQQRDSIQYKYDSLLTESSNRYKELEDKKQPIRYAIKNTRSTVDNLDKEQLRRAMSEY